MSRTAQPTAARTLAITAAITLVLGLTTMCAASAAADAPADLRHHPGFVDLDGLGLFGPGGPQTDIDLRGPMMRMVAAATEREDPGLSAAVAGLERIRVLGSEHVGDSTSVRDAIARAGERLESEGWTRMARVAEDDELVLVLVRENGDRLAGMAVLVVDDDEVSLVNLVGDIDPATIGRLAASLDVVPDLDDLAELSAEGGR